MTSFRRGLDVRQLIGVAGICAGAIFAARRFLVKPHRAQSDLTGKGVLITGGSRGFGLALAYDFGSRGARLALCACDSGELERACSALRAKGIEAHPLVADITQSGQLNNLINQAVSVLGSIDVLVNDAGRITVGPSESFTQQDFEDAMNLMFWAPVNLTHAVLPHMREKGTGQIINITSVGGRVSIPHLLPYCCAKFAFVGFSTGLSRELTPEGIRVLTVVPGLMRTGSYLKAEFKGDSKDEFAWFGLLGNLPGFSVDAGYAAKQVRLAVENGDGVCTISLPAKVLVALEGIAPEVNQEVLSLVNRYLLPQSSSKRSSRGKNLNPALNALYQGVTALGRLAATRLNEK